jgi:hypothetical protein
MEPKTDIGPRGGRTVLAPPNWGLDVVPLSGRLNAQVTDSDGAGPR